jgi:hypothetical protein
MDKWEYRTLSLTLETWYHGQEKYEDYVVTYTDGTRLEGLEMVMRRYLDDGGWDFVTSIPTEFRFLNGGRNFIAETLTVIFRRKFSLEV